MGNQKNMSFSERESMKMHRTWISSNGPEKREFENFRLIALGRWEGLLKLIAPD